METHGPVCEVMMSTGHGSELADVRRQVRRVLKAAADNELNQWLERVPRQPIYRCLRAISSDQSARTRELRTLQRQSRELVERLGAQRAGVQTDLIGRLDYLEGDEVGDE